MDDTPYLVRCRRNPPWIYDGEVSEYHGNLKNIHGACKIARYDSKRYDPVGDWIPEDDGMDGMDGWED